MFSLNRNFGKIYLNVNYASRLFCIKANENGLELKSNFSSHQNDKILEILNKSSPEHLSKYKISLPCIQRLVNLKAKKGPFKSLSEVLEVEGFGERILTEIGENIICQNDTREMKTKLPKLNKRIKHLLVPEMNSKTFFSLNSAIAIHVEPTGIGWARLQTQNNTLTSWSCENLSNLPQKMVLNDTFNLALNILRKTPPGDVYIFEALNNLNLQTQPKQTQVATYNQQSELISMLLTLINTSVSHNKSLQEPNTKKPVQGIENTVFFLKSNIPARYFRTLIGTEKVSAVTAISELLKYIPNVHDSMTYTPIIFDQNLKQNFLSQSSANKELLAQALMLAVSFVDLYVRRKPLNYEAVNNNRNIKKQSS